MKKPFLSFLYSCFVSLALVSAAAAENSATFTLYTPRYYKDSLLVSANPSFVLGQRGSFTSLESFPSSATYVVDVDALAQAHPGYYVSEWELSTAWSSGVGGTAIQTQTGGTSFTVSFDYKWAATHGTALELTVYLSPVNYTVTYNANGGAWTGGEPGGGPWQYGEGGAAPLAGAVSYPGHGLTGWTSSTGKTLSPGEAFTGESLGVTENGKTVYLTAQWSTESYTATIAAGTGGSGPSTLTYAYSEQQQTRAITLPTREGHSISGWTVAGYSGSAPTIQGNVLTIPARTSGSFTMTPAWQANTYALRLEKTAGIAKIYYRLGSQTYYDETAESMSVPAVYGTAWSAYALAVDGCATNGTCAASGTIGVGGAEFRPTADAKPYPLQLVPGTGIAKIYYRTNETQKTWISTTVAAVVPVLFGNTWSAYAVAAPGYTHTATSAAMPKTDVMTTDGGKFAPMAVPNVMTVRYEPNGSTDSRLMSDETFTYDEPKALALNKYSKLHHVYYYSDGTLVDECDATWTFAGWNSRADGYGDYFYADGEEVTNPCGSTGAAAGEPAVVVLLYAQWSGGTVTLPLPKKAGYDFSGWYTALTGGQRIGGAGTSFAPTAATKLYAHWRAHVTQLAFVVDGQEKTEFAHTVANGGKYSDFGSLPELTSDDPKKIFLGWYTEPEGGTRITDATTVNLTGDSTTLYAQWETLTYTITYEPNGGEIKEYQKPGYKPGQAFALPTDVTRTGRTFLGWYDNPTFEGEPITGITSVDRGDKTFYAKWSTVAGDKVTLTFVNVSGYSFYTNTSTHIWYWQTLENKDTPRLAKTYAYGDVVTLPGVLFFQEGLTQEGWRLEGSNKTNPDTWKTADVSELYGTVAENLTFHTIWRTNSYTVIYNGNGGTYAWGEYKGRTEYQTDPISYGDNKLTHAADAWERDGYTCIGWAVTNVGHAVYGCSEYVSNLTAVDKGVVTLYAVWAEEKKVAEESPVPPASTKFAAVCSQPLASSPFSSSSTSQQSYTIHFSSGAVVVNPQAMTNWTVSGSVMLPDCLYTNVEGATFAGWTCNGKPAESPFALETAFDGQIVTVTAAWEPLECGDLSNAVGLTNAVLTCTDGKWQVSKAEGREEGTCLKAAPGTASCLLSMSVNGPGKLTFWWKTNLQTCLVSNVVDGTSAVLPVSDKDSWEEKMLTIAGAGVHTIEWYVPQRKTGNPTFWLDDVCWEPEQPTYALTATAEPTEGGGASVDGESFVAGAEATLTAEANPGWQFSQWNDGSTDTVHKVTVWGDITNYVARFVKEDTYHVSVSAVPEDGGAVTGGGDYPAGTMANLTATARDGWTFLHWSGGSTNPTNAIIVQGEASYTAFFTNVYEVVASAGIGGKASVEGGSKHAAGTEAKLTATANGGYKFVQWSDGATENPHTVTVLCTTNLTATFQEVGPTPVTTNYYYVAFDGNGATGGAMAEQTNVCGTNAVLCSNAFVRTGYTFDGWTAVTGKTVGKTYKDGATVTDLATTNRAALLKAVWKPVEYMISFDRNGGTGTMSPNPMTKCQYGIGYQLPDCTFSCAKMAFSNWVDAAGTTYADGAIVRDLSEVNCSTVTLYAVWGGHGQAFVNITGHTATKYYTGRPFTVSGYDVDIPSEGYYEKDFTTAPGTVTSLTETDVGTYCMNLSTNSFTNLVSSVDVLFDIKGDGWLKILPSRIGGEPGTGVVPAGGLSKFDVTVEYGTTYDVSAISNDFVKAYGACAITYGALESGPWSAATPTFGSVGTTSFWYCVTAANREPFVHEVAVQVLPRDIANATVTGIPDQAYTGKAITPAVTVTDGNPSIVTVDDYTVKCLNNVNPGTATVLLTGKGNYTGTKKAYFAILPRPQVCVTITGRTRTVPFDGGRHDVSGYDFAISGDKGYTQDDFWCKAWTYVTRTAVGTTCANLKAADFENLNSAFDVEFVVARDISVTVTQGTVPGEPGSGTVPAGGLSKYDVTAVYDGQPHTLDFTALTNAFAGAYNNVAAVEFAAAAGGPWSTTPIAITDVGSVAFWYRVTCESFEPFAHEAKVTVTPRDIAKATVAPIPDQIATGEPIEPEVTVTDGTPSIITAGDYDVVYSDNVAIGTAMVTLTGKGNYAGTLEQTFEIVPLPGYYVVDYGEPVSVNLQADFPDKTIKSVSGLPSGLKYKNGYVTGKSTKAVTEKVATITFMDRTKEKTYWTVKADENYGVKIDFGVAETGASSATVGVGTAVEWTVTPLEDNATVTISKLPTGLKYNKKTGLITGTPTKAKDYAMTVKTKANGSTVTQTFAITVEALPPMMVGTFYGAAEVDDVAGQFQLKLTAAGKATGHFYAAGKKISFKSTALGEAGGCYVATVSYTHNKTKCTDEIVLAKAATVEGAKGDDVDIWAASVSGSAALEKVDARRDVIKEVFGKVVPKTTTYDVEDESFEEGEYLKAKVTTAGKVTVSGKLLSEAGKLTSVSCSTNLIVDDDGKPYCWITIYKAVGKSEPIVYDEVWCLPDED